MVSEVEEKDEIKKSVGKTNMDRLRDEVQKHKSKSEVDKVA